jgi:hypothetical protein
MKKIILSVGLVMSSLFYDTVNAQIAQPGSCALNTSSGGSGNGNKVYPSSCSNIANYIPTQTTDTLTYRINFHFFKHANGSAGGMDHVTLQDCKNAMWGLNNNWFMNITNSPTLPTSPPTVNVYPDSRIRFKFTNMYVHNDERAFQHWETHHLTNPTRDTNVFVPPSIYDSYFYNTYSVNPKSEINVFFLDSTVTGAAGIAIVPGVVYMGFYGKWWINTATWPWGTADLLPHELGHAVGNLTHTNYGPQFPDYTLDTGPWGFVPCTQGVTSNNIMDYNQCRNYLSPDQIANFYLGAAYQSNGVFGGGFNATQWTTLCNWDNTKTVNITSTQTWTNARALGGDLVVKAGNQLTIKCLVSLPPNGRVIVEPTAKLVIDGGTLTTNCSAMWTGVEVWGDNTKAQTINVTTGMPNYQGMLSIINNGSIENAQYGVGLYASDGQGNINWNKTGGIVQAVGASFNNNNKDVAFLAYAAPANVPNKSYFYNCGFTISNPLTGGWADSRISMYAVKGVTIHGCNFTTSLTGASLSDAIVTNDASFTIDNYNATQTSFNGFNKCINAQNTISSNYIIVNNTLFNSFNNYGIYLTNSNSSTINNNTFSVNNSILGSAVVYGSYFNQCSGYLFKNNIFNGGTNTGQIGGSYINASGVSANSAYNNVFNNLTYGQWAAEQNQSTNGTTGLVISCNDFNNCTYDIGIQSLTNNTLAGIAKAQGAAGSPTTYVSNTYNNTGSCSNQNKIYIYNAQSYGLNHASFTGNLYEPLPTACASSLVTSIQGSGTYNKTTYCPANPGNGCGGGGCRLAQVHSDLKKQQVQILSLTEGTEPHQNAQAKLANMQNQYELLVNEKIRNLLYDTTNNNPYDSIIYYLHTLGHNPAAHKAIALAYLQKKDYVHAHAFVDSAKNAGTSNKDFADYHHAIINAMQTPNYYAAVKNNTILKNQMLGYANNYYSEMNAGARAFLKQVHGINIAETILTPVQQVQNARQGAEINPVIALSDDVKLYPNPATNNLMLDYTLNEQDLATVVIRDVNGKIAQAINLTSGNKNHQADISNLSNGIYFVSLQKNGMLISTQKLVIVK